MALQGIQLFHNRRRIDITHQAADVLALAFKRTTLAGLFGDAFCFQYRVSHVLGKFDLFELIEAKINQLLAYALQREHIPFLLAFTDKIVIRHDV